MVSTIQEVNSLDTKLINEINLKDLNIKENNSKKFFLNNFQSLNEILSSPFDSNIQNLILIENHKNNISSNQIIIYEDEAELAIPINQIVDNFCKTADHKFILVSNMNNFKQFIIFTQHCKYYGVSLREDMDKFFTDDISQDNSKSELISIFYNQFFDNENFVIDVNGNFYFDQNSQLTAFEFDCSESSTPKRWSNNKYDLPLKELPEMNYYSQFTGEIKDVLSQVGEDFAISKI